MSVMQADADFEVTTGIIRIFDNGDAYETPFDMAVFVVGDHGVATLKGLRSDQQRLRPHHARLIARTLAEKGFHEVRWYRQTKSGDSLRLVRTRIGEPGKIDIAASEPASMVAD